jgi:hypothetical protein
MELFTLEAKVVVFEVGQMRGGATSLVTDAAVSLRRSVVV